MANLVLFLLFLTLLGYVIERNHRRRRPWSMSGSVNYEDRDERRVTDDLRALPAEPVRTSAKSLSSPLWTIGRAPLRR
jgi:hypothetical protein